MAKPFASSADTAAKKETLEILADGVYALAAEGGAGVSHLLELLEKEMRVAMTLTSVKNVGEITGDLLVRE